MMDLERWNLLTPGDNVTRVGSSQRERVQTVVYDKGTGNVTSIAINDGTMEGITLFRGDIT